MADGATPAAVDDDGVLVCECADPEFVTHKQWLLCKHCGGTCPYVGSPADAIAYMRDRIKEGRALSARRLRT